MSQHHSIINLEELQTIIHEKETIILDARVGENARQNYLQQHIKGARFIDLDNDLAAHTHNPSQGGRHPLPEIFDFSKTISELGIKEDSQVVIYDDKAGANAAARAWWMLKSFGIENVKVINGGFQDLSGLEMSSGEEKYHQSVIKIPEKWKLATTTIDEVENLLQNNNAVVIDVRDAYRYLGESEPIDPIAGHIPGAINLPFSINLDGENRFLSPEILKEKYQHLFQNPNQEIIVHCGSGVTACHTILAMDYAGLPMPKLFVGSWSEWCRSSKAIAIG
jgi:thiosulfate/3-mercaptopyruvate sulfurtransferase